MILAIKNLGKSLHTSVFVGYNYEKLQNFDNIFAIMLQFLSSNQGIKGNLVYTWFENHLADH
jgi:hypothetical protein